MLRTSAPPVGTLGKSKSRSAHCSRRKMTIPGTNSGAKAGDVWLEGRLKPKGGHKPCLLFFFCFCSAGRGGGEGGGGGGVAGLRGCRLFLDFSVFCFFVKHVFSLSSICDQDQRAVRLQYPLVKDDREEDARLRKNSTSANSTSASWPNSNWPKSRMAEVAQMNLCCFVFFSFFFLFRFLPNSSFSSSSLSASA